MTDTRSRILNSAEKLVRTGGYNGFSFREIASSIGIKSASVHHHFPTKEKLTLEVARRYEQTFFDALGEPAPAGTTPEVQLERYCEVFRTAFESSGRACLCGILSNEAEQLPESVRRVITEFVSANISWLEEAMEPARDRGSTEDCSDSARERAELVYCALEGAMGVAALKQDGDWIARVSRSLRKTALCP